MTVSHSVSVAQVSGPPQSQIQALHRAIAELLGVDPAQALALAQTCCALTPDQGSGEAAESRLLLGRALQVNGQQVEALKEFCAAAEIFGRLGHPFAEAEAHSLMGKAYLDLGRFGEAAHQLEHAIRLVQDRPDGRSVHATALNHLAIVNHLQG